MEMEISNVYSSYVGNKELLKYDVDLREFDATRTKLKAKIKEITG